MVVAKNVAFMGKELFYEKLLERIFLKAIVCCAIIVTLVGREIMESAHMKFGGL